MLDDRMLAKVKIERDSLQLDGVTFHAGWLTPPGEAIRSAVGPAMNVCAGVAFV
jgi:hypothetical protein